MPFIPSKDAAFAAWAANMMDITEAQLDEFHVPQDQFTPLKGLHTAFDAAYAKALEPNRGPVDIADKNTARAALEKALRGFIKAFLEYSPYVSDHWRREMGLPVHDTKPTPVPAPSSIPEYDFDTSVPGRLTLRFWDKGSERRGKPAGVHGAEIRWEVRDDPPAKEDDLVNSDIATRSPHSYTFTGDKRGQKVYFCLRWENGTGKKGPWGAVLSAVIP
jgi:hypothetical protein